MTSRAICVFGTSNGLFKDGYVAGIREQVGAGACENRSVGASTSFIWFATHHGVDFSRFDWAVIDYCVNDGLMIRSGANSVENWRNSVLTAIAEVREGGCQPALLILPSRQTMEGDNPLLPEALRLAREQCVPFLNGFALMRELLRRRANLQIGDLFRDPAHLHPSIARLIGVYLVQALSSVPPPASYGSAPGSARAFRFAPVADWSAPDMVRERATSLTTRSFRTFKSEEIYPCPAEPGERLVGVALDLSKSHGTLVIDGDRRWAKSWTNIYQRQWLGVERAMVFSMLAVGGQVGPDRNGHLLLRVRPDHADVPNEAWGALASSDDAEPALELNGLLFERSVTPSSIPLPFPEATDLGAGAPESLFVALAEAAELATASAETESRLKLHTKSSVPPILNIVNGVLIAPDGELFLAGGGHNVLKFAAGEIRAQPESIENLSHNLTFRRNMAKRHGFGFAHMIAPEKYRVMPDSFPRSNSKSLAEAYARGGCEGMIDPVAEMRAENRGRTYYRTDTHWAPHGKIVAARLIAQAVGVGPVDEAEAAALAALHPAPDLFCGDLGRKLDPAQSENTFVLRPSHGVRMFENGLPHDYARPVNDGRLVLMESEAPTARGTLLIFGDSYLHQSMSALSFFFKRVIFCRTRWFHEEMVLMARPDYVVTQQAERYLSSVSSDFEAPPFLLLAQMLGRTPSPSQDEALAIGQALSGGRKLDMRTFSRAAPAQQSPPAVWPAPGARVALLGDSRLGGTTRIGGKRLGEPVPVDSVQKYMSGYGFATWADMFLEGALDFEHEDNFGYHDGTTRGVLARVPDVLAGGNYWACIYSAGTNDLKPENGPLSEEETKASLVATWDALTKAGLHLFIVQDLPRTNEAWSKFSLTGPALDEAVARSARLRRFVQEYAAGKPLVHVLDATDAVIATGEREPHPLVHFDGTHTSPWDAWRVGHLLAEVIRPHLPRPALLAEERDRYDGANTYGNLLPNGLMKGEPVSVGASPLVGRLPPGWSALLGGSIQQGSLVLDTIPSADGAGGATSIVGQLVRSDRSQAVVGMRVRIRSHDGLAGRLVQGKAVARIEAGALGLRGVDARLLCFPGDNSPPSVAHALEVGAAKYWPGEASHRLVLRTPRLRAPPADVGVLELILVAVFDGTREGGCNFSVSFERASLRVAD